MPAPTRKAPPASPPTPATARGRRQIPAAPGPRPEIGPARRTQAPAKVSRPGATIRRDLSVRTVAPPRVEPAPVPAFTRSGRAGGTPRVARVVARTAFQRRFGVPHDTQGPKVRLGLAWATLVAAAVAVRPVRLFGLAVIFGLVAGFAAMSVIDARRRNRTSTDRWAAGLGASSLAVAATLGSRGLGAGLLLLVAGAVAVAYLVEDADRSLVERSSDVVLAAGLCGGAAAALVLLADYEIGAVVILLALTMVYDASDFVVGSGATNAVEGPLAGLLFMVPVAVIFGELGAPPFRGADVWMFTLLAMVSCPLGQIVASALLPRPDEHAPGLRRLDSLLVAAPVWAFLVGLYLGHAR
ncbi:MAG: hypothetical protein ACR2MB_08175 [Acidimicrobiales bacterium]